MKILLLTFNYGESSSPRAIRWNSICKGIAELGHELTVIHAGMQENTESQISYCTHQLKTSAVKENIKVPKNESVFSRVKRAIKTLILYFRWPDYGILWAIKSLPRLRGLLKNNEYDLIISVSHPFSSHLLGLYAKKYNNNNVRWHVDIGDPFSLISDIKINSNIFRRINNIAEKLVLNKSDRIFVTNSIIKDEYLNEFNVSGDKIKVLLPIRVEPPIRYQFNPYSHVIYAGRFYPKVREPIFVVKLLSMIKSYSKDYSCDIYGCHVNDIVDTFRLDVSSLSDVSINGMLDKHKLNGKISSASIIINLGNTTDNQLPSKIADLMFCGKPVINVYQSEKDLSISLLSAHPACLSIYSLDLDSKDTMNRVYGFLKMIESTDFSESYENYVSMNYASFDARVITKEYISNGS
ncbi:glycosyltransferase [Vibrio cyclitrophicus]